MKRLVAGRVNEKEIETVKQFFFNIATKTAAKLGCAKNDNAMIIRTSIEMSS